MCAPCGRPCASQLSGPTTVSTVAVRSQSTSCCWQSPCSAQPTASTAAAAVEAVGCAEQGECQQKLVDWLHGNEVETVVGPLSWDEAGRPQSAHMIQQWVGGEIKIVLPEDLKEADFIFPKPEW